MCIRKLLWKFTKKKLTTYLLLTEVYVFSKSKLKNARDSRRSQPVMPLWPWCDLERCPPRMQLSWPQRWRRPGSRPRATVPGSRTRPRQCGRHSGGGTAAKWAEEKSTRDGDVFNINFRWLQVTVDFLAEDLILQHAVELLWSHWAMTPVWGSRGETLQCSGYKVAPCQKCRCLWSQDEHLKIAIKATRLLELMKCRLIRIMICLTASDICNLNQLTKGEKWLVDFYHFNQTSGCSSPRHVDCNYRNSVWKLSMLHC